MPRAPVEIEMSRRQARAVAHDGAWSGSSPRRVVALVSLFALLPAVVLACLSVLLNHFALIDDWVSVSQATGSFADNFRMHASGRFNFFYRMLHWIVIRVLAPEPWAFSLVNGLFFVVAAWQVCLLAGRIGAGPVGRVLATWLFTLNLSVTENLFTLGKAEPKQLVFWLVALGLLMRALDGRTHRWQWCDAPLMAAVTATAILFKESAILLGVPLATFALIACGKWWGTPAREWRRSAFLVVAGAFPLALGAALAVGPAVRAGSHGREQVMNQPLTLSTFEVALLGSDAILTAMLLGGILAGGLLLLKSTRALRGAVALVLVQLVGVFAFYTVLRAQAPYQYYPAAAFGAILLGVGLSPSEPRSTFRSWMSVGVAVVFLSYGASRTVAGASALGAWSWLYKQLTTAVVTARPSRVLFYRSGSPEVYSEAVLAWAEIPRLPVVIGVLDSPTGPDHRVQSVALRGLRPGDWILEEFGTAWNTRIPFRDMNVTHLLEHGLIGPAGAGLLPVRIIHEFEARFRFPASRLALLPRNVGLLEWRVYEVTDVPRVVFESLDADHWMRERATLLVRPWTLKRVTLRFRAIVYAAPGSVYDNELTIRSGERTVARCPAKAQGISECSFDLASWGSHGPEEWVAFDLIAARAFSPASLGLSAETRHLSFNFGPTWEAGSAALFEAGAPAP